jgi:hypothetical protein
LGLSEPTCALTFGAVDWVSAAGSEDGFVTNLINRIVDNLQIKVHAFFSVLSLSLSLSLFRSPFVSIVMLCPDSISGLFLIRSIVYTSDSRTTKSEFQAWDFGTPSWLSV